MMNITKINHFLPRKWTDKIGETGKYNTNLLTSRQHL